MRTSAVLTSALWLLVGCTHTESFHHDYLVTADFETAPVPSRDDAADDPAIWINQSDPSNSLIIGTDKGSGLLSYTLEGDQVQYLPNGKFNNVDLRSRGNNTLIAATQRDPSRIALFLLDHVNGQIEQIASHETELAEPYGICMYQDVQDYVIANSKDGTFIQYEVGENYALIPRRSWQTQTQPEGCVADDAAHRLYYGEEAAGIWEISARVGAPTEAISFDRVENGNLVADVEGLTLYSTEARTLLIASSQGDNSYAIYDVASRAHLVSFQIAAGAVIDGASETDGIAATPKPLPGFSKGILVVQDGYNLNPAEKQNFKIVSWEKIAQLLP